MEVHVGRNVADLTAVNSNLVCEHARRRNLDRVRPIIIIVAQSVREVEDGIFGDFRRVKCHVEMRRLHSALRNGVRHKEEVKRAVNDFGLLNEAVVDVRSLRRVRDGRVATTLPVSTVTLLTTELEESLTHALIHNDQSGLG